MGHHGDEEGAASAETSSNLERGRRHYSTYLISIVIFMCLGSASYGYSAAIIGTTLGQPSFITYMGLDTAPNSSSLLGAITALFYVGGVAGSFCHSFVSNKFGRKASVSTGAVFILISGALLTASVDVAMFITFRFFNGWGAFQLLASVPLWVTEVVPPTHRGILTDIHAVMINLGYVIAGYTGLGFYFFHHSNSWRGPMGVQLVLPFILLCGIYWMPESPRFLVAKDRIDEALQIVRRLHANPDDADDHFADVEFYQIRKQVESDWRNKTGYQEIFKRKSYRKRAMISMFLTFSLMSSGVLVINNYGSLIYSRLGFGPTDVLYFLTGWTSCAFVFNIIAMLFVDRLPRNRLISCGFFVCMCSLIVEAALQKNFLTSTNKGALGAAVAMTYLYVVSYSLCLDGPTYFYIGEIWPSHLRAQGFALSTSVLCATNIVWLQAAPTAFKNIGWAYYIFFIVFAALGSLVALIFFPDTLHKPLEETALMFGDEADVVVLQSHLRDADVLENVKANLREEEKQHSRSEEVEDIQQGLQVQTKL